MDIISGLCTDSHWKGLTADERAKRELAENIVAEGERAFSLPRPRLESLFTGYETIEKIKRNYYRVLTLSSSLKKDQVSMSLTIT